jgi:ankyrin repeat protein
MQSIIYLLQKIENSSHFSFEKMTEPIALLEQEVIYPKYSWGEMYETLKTMQENGDDPQDEIFARFFETVKELDEAKTVSEVKTILTKYNFSDIEIERINSPCLDGLLLALKVPESSLMAVVVDAQKIETCKYLLGKNMGTRTLIRACKLNNIEMVKLMLIEASFFEKDKGLQIASARGFFDIVQLLLQNKANVHFENGTPLCVACQNGHLDVAKLLIQYNADIHTDNEYCLRASALNGHKKMVEFLLDCGALISIDNNQPLRNAVKADKIDIVEMLLDRGAYIDAGDILSWAYVKGNIEIINFLYSRLCKEKDNISLFYSHHSCYRNMFCFQKYNLSDL